MAMKGIDLFLGIRTEQTLRDAARASEGETGHGGNKRTELCPIGKKDWIAGERIGMSVRFKELSGKQKAVIRDLLHLNSHQRIRHENIRLFAVRQPVPVFKDPLPDEFVDERSGPASDRASDHSGTEKCPVCGAEVHSYNMQYDPWGRTVGCYLCRGEQEQP